jgi:hypothetical protein
MLQMEILKTMYTGSFGAATIAADYNGRLVIRKDCERFLPMGNEELKQVVDAFKPFSNRKRLF